MTTLATPSPVSAAAPASTRTSRIDAIDLLRGIVMVIMVLDHMRDYVLAETLTQFNATDLTKTTVAIFLTRWITHFCAPVFVLLAGTGASLQRQRKGPGELSRFLVTRGLWLIVLEFTVVRTMVMFSLDYSTLGLAQVIWVIGVSMILLAALVRVPPTVVGALGLLIVCFHNTLDGVQPAPGLGADVWRVLHGAGPVALGHPSPVVIVIYALLPWFGVLLLGYALGIVYEWDAEARRRFLIRTGVAAIVAFIAIRLVNMYGDPQPWSAAIHPVLSFINTTKYPPSLDYLLMTLGPALILLALFERVRDGSVVRAMIVFGRVPLFFYLLQWPLTHGIALIAGLMAHRPTAYLFNYLIARAAKGAGFSLPATYAMWALAIAIEYPLCAWYAGVKRRHRDWWWLSYL